MLKEPKPINAMSKEPERNISAPKRIGEAPKGLEKIKKLYYWAFPGMHSVENPLDMEKFRLHFREMDKKIKNENGLLVLDNIPRWVKKDAAALTCNWTELNNPEDISRHLKENNIHLDDNFELHSTGEFLSACTATGTGKIANALDIPLDRVRFHVASSYSHLFRLKNLIEPAPSQTVESNIQRIRATTLALFISEFKPSKYSHLSAELRNHAVEAYIRNESHSKALKDMEKVPGLLEVLPDSEFNVIREMHGLGKYLQEKLKPE